MNKQTLQNIANATLQVSNAEIEEIKQLIGSHPFYPLPHVVLAKIYFEKEHYLFENALNQAAMRVNDREWLYHYIHGDEGFEKTETSESLVVDYSDTTAVEPIGMDEAVELSTEIEGTETSEELLKNDLSAFLSDLEIAEPIEEIEQVDEVPMLESSETIEPMQEEPLIEQEELETPIEEIQSSIELEAETIVEQVAEMPVDETSTVEPIKEQALDMGLRKHPVYNVESFLSDGKSAPPVETETTTEKDFFYWLNHPKPEENVEETIEATEEEVFTEDKTLSIIEQFIKANPSISRPKKEFYSAENMAKRSENVDFDFVSETLANIYYEQGNIDLAIKAYEKLSLQNPLKQTYFASLIEKIKKEKR